MRPRLIDPKHESKRSVLRIAGPLVLGLGVVLTAIGFGTVILGDPFSNKGMAALPFVGMPLMFVGLVMTSLGFMGAVTRYQAAEVAPVATDTINYVAEETQDSVRTVANAIGEGLRGETTQEPLTCPACSALNEAGSRFCDQCGGAFPTDQTCPKCGQANDPDARFCDHCGDPLASG